ncbi:SWI/SNF chromatin-remodeling complex subunit [Rhodotorula mucilaginosa]|uniref:SWI/SNF chromatin-remodeling complex subunit n=1 Tax=Rhodotorula mucilaginosa TaxID=5537 RepID=A0A9P6W6P4_RHOMI|nr:SWI/SNF chromatin-remodeling complex subunit [Rhodotorula mucilaginosa]
MSTATPAAPNGFATGSPQVQNQALASQYAGQPDAGPNRRSSISAYGVVAAPNVLPMATIPSAVQGMQLSQMQQQALLQRSQHALRPFSAAAPPSAVPPPPPRRPTGPPPAPVIERGELEKGAPEWKVPLRKSTTVIRETETGEEFPSVSEKDQRRIKQWMERDAAYEDEVIAANYDLRVSMQTLFHQAAREQDWLGYPTDPQHRGPPRIQFPADRRAEQARGTRGPYRKPVPLSKSYARAISKTQEVLVPIRLELEWEMYKLRDTFTWNLAETAITPQIFASHLCADFRLPREPFEREIVNAVQKQLTEAQLGASYSDHLADRLTTAREESRRWLEGRATKRRRTKRSEVEVNASGSEGEKIGAEATEGSDDGEDGAAEAADLLSLKDFSNPSDELRLVIKLDITLDSIQLVDQFEWDISDPNNSPEAFAEAFAAELGLSGEFVTAISHSIREQIDFYTRSLCILGYAPGRGIADEELRRDFLPPLQEPFRTDTADDFTPALNQLVSEEVERHDREHEREIRRKRRQTKGRGVTLPDREPIRTHRTLLPRPLPGYVTVQYDERHDKACPQPELSLPFLLEAKAYPPKPANLETVSNSPLKLVPAKDKATNAGGLAATAAANRYRKGLAQGDSAADVLTPPPRPPPPKIDPVPLGLHEHIIDGQWYCANCGCPGSIAVGRRKGPTGKDSLCGECGKYFHRYKRNRPCVYTREFEPHQALVALQPPKKQRRGRGREPGRVGAIANEAASANEANPATRTSSRGTPVSQALSPVSSAHEGESDDDESSAPSLKRKRVAQYGSPDRPFVQSDSGNSDLDSDDPEGYPPVTRQRSTTATTPPAQSVAPKPNTSQATGPSGFYGGPEPEPWMLAAAADLRARHVDERFEFVPRPRPDPSRPQEWRVRCLDCPGKVYNLGPGETLEGYTIHFKNRQHRINVEMRVSRA